VSKLKNAKAPVSTCGKRVATSPNVFGPAQRTPCSPSEWYENGGRPTRGAPGTVPGVNVLIWTTFSASVSAATSAATRAATGADTSHHAH